MLDVNRNKTEPPTAYMKNKLNTGVLDNKHNSDKSNSHISQPEYDKHRYGEMIDFHRQIWVDTVGLAYDG